MSAGPHPLTAAAGQLPHQPPRELPLWNELGYFVLMVFLLVYLQNILRVKKDGTREPKSRYRWLFAIVLLVPFFLLFNEARVTRLYGWLVTNLGLHRTQFLAGTVTVGLGVLAYLFKLRNKMYFGLCEVTFGFVAAWSVSRGLDVPNITLAQFVGLAGSAYIVARGLGNCHEARSSSDGSSR